MRNLIQFIWHNQFTFLFLLLEVLGFFLLASNNSLQNSKLQTFSTGISGGLANMQRSYTAYLGLKEKNVILQEENAQLRAKLNQTIHAKPSTTSGLIGYDVLSASAISSTYSKGNNYLLLDQGYANGVRSQQAVISSTGAVGIVTSTTSNYASVMPLIHSQCQLSCKIKGAGFFGLCKWDGKDYREGILEDIPNHANVQMGDTILTRGSSGIFPPDQIVGFITEFERDESSGFQMIRFTYAADFRNTESVYVIHNQQKQQLDTLLQNLSDE